MGFTFHNVMPFNIFFLNIAILCLSCKKQRMITLVLLETWKAEKVSHTKKKQPEEHFTATANWQPASNVILQQIFPKILNLQIQAHFQDNVPWCKVLNMFKISSSALHVTKRESGENCAKGRKLKIDFLPTEYWIPIIFGPDDSGIQETEIIFFQGRPCIVKEDNAKLHGLIELSCRMKPQFVP